MMIVDMLCNVAALASLVRDQGRRVATRPPSGCPRRLGDGYDGLGMAARPGVSPVMSTSAVSPMAPSPTPPTTALLHRGFAKGASAKGA